MTGWRGTSPRGHSEPHKPTDPPIDRPTDSLTDCLHVRTHRPHAPGKAGRGKRYEWAGMKRHEPSQGRRLDLSYLAAYRPQVGSVPPAPVVVDVPVVAASADTDEGRAQAWPGLAQLLLGA